MNAEICGLVVAQGIAFAAAGFLGAVLACRGELARLEKWLANHADGAWSREPRFHLLSGFRIAQFFQIIRRERFFEARSLRCPGAPVRLKHDDVMPPETERSGESIWQRCLQKLHAKFPTAVAAVVREAGSNGITFAAEHRQSPALERALLELYRESARPASAPHGKRSARSTAPSVWSTIEDCGFSAGVACPVAWRSVDGAAEALLWVGFPSGAAPTPSDARFIEAAADEASRALSLSGAVAAIRAEMSAAQSSERAKSDFLAHVSHDMRSPLHNIKAILALLLEPTADAAENEMLGAALRNCAALEELFDDVIDFTRFNAGQLKPRIAAVPLRAVAAEVEESHRLAAREKGLTLALDGGAELSVAADKRHLRRILMNIVGNAVKYTDHGTVAVRIAEEQGRIVVRVTDTGIGMTSEEVQRLFVPFSRFDRTERDGVGLGLAVTKILVEANGGSLSVSSKLYGGSTFEVSLVRAEEPICTSAPSAAFIDKNLPVQPDTRPKVLIVDDDRESCLSLARAFSGFPVETMVATSVPDGIGLFTFASPDAVVTDLRMPHGGGRRLLEHIRSSGREIPIYCLTGDAASMDIAEQQAAGVFQKPVDIQALWGAIASGVNSFSQRSPRISPAPRGEGS